MKVTPKTKSAKPKRVASKVNKEPEVATQFGQVPERGYIIGGAAIAGVFLLILVWAMWPK